MSVFRIYAVKIGSSFITSTTGSDIQDGITVDRTLVDGDVDPNAANVIDESPIITIETLDIAGALAICGFGTTTGSVTIYGAKQDGAGRASGTVHEIVEAATARIYPTTLTMQHGQHARLSFRVVPFSNSETVHPLARKPTATLPAQTLGVNRFSIGKVAIGAQAITGKTNVSVDFGIALDEAMGKYDGANWLKEAQILSRLPRIVVSSVDPGLRAITMATNSTDRTGGLALAGVLTVFARKRSPGGYVTDATTQHVKMTVNNGVVYPQGQTGNPIQYTFAVDPIRDASNASVIVDTASAIS